MLDLKFFCVSIYIDGASRQAVKTSDCGSDMRGFESHHPPHKKDFDIGRSLFYNVKLKCIV